MKTFILLFTIIGALGLTSCGSTRGCKNTAYAHISGNGYVIQNISNTEINPAPVVARSNYGVSSVSREVYVSGGPTGCMRIIGSAQRGMTPRPGCIIGYHNGNLCMMQPCAPPHGGGGPTIGGNRYYGNPGMGYYGNGYGSRSPGLVYPYPPDRGGPYAGGPAYPDVGGDGVYRPGVQPSRGYGSQSYGRRPPPRYR